MIIFTPVFLKFEDDDEDVKKTSKKPQKIFANLHLSAVPTGWMGYFSHLVASRYKKVDEDDDVIDF